MNIELDWETTDKIVLASLYETYDTILENILYTERLICEKGQKPNLVQDLEDLEDVQLALITILKYYDVRSKADERISQIEKKVIARFENMRYKRMLGELKS